MLRDADSCDFKNTICVPTAERQRTARRGTLRGRMVSRSRRSRTSETASDRVYDEQRVRFRLRFLTMLAQGGTRRDERLLVMDSINVIQPRLQRLAAEVLDSVNIHARFV